MEFKAPAFRYLAALWRADTSQTALYSFLQNSVLSLWNNAQSHGSTPGYTLSQSLSVCLCLSSYVHVCLLSLFSLSIFVFVCVCVCVCVCVRAMCRLSQRDDRSRTCMTEDQ